MTPVECQRLIDAVVAKASALRAAGVLEIGVEGLTIKLAPALPDTAPPEANTTDAETVEEEPNMWNDPVMYGRRRGVPGKHEHVTQKK